MELNKEFEAQDLDQEDDTMMLILDDRTEVKCYIIAIFSAADKKYIALLPVECDEEHEEDDAFLYGYSEDADGEPILESLNDDEYKIAYDGFDAFLDEEMG